MAEEDRPDPFVDHELVAVARVGMDVERELASSPTWIAIREAAKAHEHEWTEELVGASPTDIDRIITCKINIYAVRAMEGFIASILAGSDEAIATLETMDTPDDV